MVLPKLPITLILIAYLFSMKPVGTIAWIGPEDNLRRTIQSLQVLQLEVTDDVSVMPGTLRQSIRSLQALAGTSALLERTSQSADKAPLLLTVVYRWIYIPSGQLDLTGPKDGLAQSYPPYLRHCTPPDLPPATPPPIVG